jgi:cell division protein FtsQ
MNQKELIKTLKRIGLIAIFLAAAILVISAVERQNVSDISGLRVHIEPLANGHFLIDSLDVQTTIQRSFGFDLAQQKVGHVNIARLERVLEADPFVLDADAYVNAKDLIIVELVQREPVIRVIDNNGLNYYMDKEGKKMPLSKHFSTRVLVATGNLPPHIPDFLEREDYLLKDLFLLGQIIREDPFLSNLTEQIHVENGSFAIVPKVGKQRIILGSFDHIEDKLERLKIFYDEIVPYKGLQEYKTIHLQYAGQVVCEK